MQLTEQREATIYELLDALADKVEDLRLRGYDMRKARHYLEALRQETTDPVWNPDAPIE